MLHQNEVPDAEPECEPSGSSAAAALWKDRMALSGSNEFSIEVQDYVPFSESHIGTAPRDGGQPGRTSEGPHVDALVVGTLRSDVTMGAMLFLKWIRPNRTERVLI